MSFDGVLRRSFLALDERGFPVRIFGLFWDTGLEVIRLDRCFIPMRRSLVFGSWGMTSRLMMCSFRHIRVQEL